MALENLLGELANEHANQFGDAHLVSGNKIKWRREFNSALTAFWDKNEGGITLPEPTAGTMVVAMGTTANAESSLVSKEIFTFPFKAVIGLQMSQRIANQEVFFEVVGCDAAGNLDEERVAAWKLSGTNATQAVYEVRNGPPARLPSAATTISTTASQTLLEMILESDEVYFASKPPDTLNAKTNNGKRDSVCPDPAGMYKLRVRFKNGSTAPASNTNVTLGFVLAIDNTDIEVEVRGGNGATSAAQSVPVAVTNAPTVNMASGTGLSIVANAGITGLLIAKVLTAAGLNNTVLKTGQGRVYGYQFANFTAAWKFVKIFNKTTTPVPGTDVPAMTIPIPPNSMVDLFMTVPVSFLSGLSYSVTGALADLDATAVAAGDVQGTLLYI